ncbi:LysE family translocator [Aestuariibius sp. HNIBRBA575]|uniref:LysE family translocator n=1 Tax=Aestuariibius sp. HNIBRBA575 TaxID=3233343 RepID=UPI0034A39B83
MISLQFLLTALVVVIAPGTGVIYTLAVGLGQGRRAAILAALGCTIGIVPHLLAASLGLAAILHTSAVAFQVVKFAGVGYLLYLAWQMLKSDGALSVSARANPEPSWAIARRAALINILNPKLSIFFLALLPPFLSGNAASAQFEMLVLGSVFMALTFVVFAGYGAFAAATRDHLLSKTAVLRWLNRGFAGVFAALAARLAFEKA